MKTIKKLCIYCSNEFDASYQEHKRGNAKYCSRTCLGKHFNAMRKQIKVPNAMCAYCDTQFYKQESEKKNSKSGLFFCCREHKDLGQRISSGITEMHLSHYKDGNCRPRQKLIELRGEKCQRCSFDKVPSIIEVHHKDRNRNNNDLNNLELLCPNCHTTEHFLTTSGRFHQLRT